MTRAFPLHWPAGWPRTPSASRGRSNFQTSHKGHNRLLQELLNQIHLLGGGGIVVSTNMPIRRDGMPYAQERRIDDPGAAVYFERKGKAQCFACDRWATIPENLRAITLTIEALRGIDRWGSGDMMERSFTGFEALPAPAAAPLRRAWWEVMQCREDTETFIVETLYRKLALRLHPDNGGNHKDMADLNAAMDEFRRARGVA